MQGTILVVDDSAMMRKVILRTLKMAGIEFDVTLEAEGGPDALEFLRDHKISLILCDLNMPEMDGIELLQKIRTEHTAEDTPVVMVSTDSTEQQVRSAIAAGAQSYIRKPFTAAHIERNLKPLLDLHA